MKTDDGIYVYWPDYQVDTESSLGKAELGHGMVIAVDNKTGKTRGSEYGRYDKENRGMARRVNVPDIQFDPNLPIQQQLNEYARKLGQSYHNGKHGAVKIYYIPGANYDELVNMMNSAETNNRDTGFYVNSDYRILDHNCGTYAADMLKKALPWYSTGGFDLYTMGTPGMVAPNSSLFKGEWDPSETTQPEQQSQPIQLKPERQKIRVKRQ